VLAQPPPSASILKRIEELPAYQRPSLERYKFDAEREVLARATEREEVKLKNNNQDVTKAEAVHSSFGGICNHFVSNKDAVADTPSNAHPGHCLESQPVEGKVTDCLSGESEGDTRPDCSVGECLTSLVKLDFKGGKEDITETTGTTQRRSVAPKAKLAAKARAISSQEDDADNRMNMFMWQAIAKRKIKNAMKASDRLGKSRSLEQLRAEEREVKLNLNCQHKVGKLISSQPAKRKVNSARDDQLSAAIKADNWAEVGSTEVLLVDLSKRDFTVSLDTDKCNQSSNLDNICETDDWEGVVLSAKVKVSTRRLHGSTDRTSLSDKPQGQRPLEEMRAEIETLVRRIAPDEIGEWFNLVSCN